MKQISLLVLILFVCAVLVPYFYTQLQPYISLEGFKSYNFQNNSVESINVENIGINNKYPLTENNVLVQDYYKISGKNGVSRDQGSKIWWHYPIFKVGSYTQINNNLKYPNNPDTGSCMPSDFCGSIYKEQQIQSNISKVLPPVNSSGGIRINYYNTE